MHVSTAGNAQIVHRRTATADVTKLITLHNSTCSRINGDTFACVCVGSQDKYTCGLTPNDACHSTPCLNGGACHTNSSSTSAYTCSCQPGFRGNNCDLDFDECASSPCFNQARCLESKTASWVAMGHFFCACSVGFLGTQCEQDDHLLDTPGARASAAARAQSSTSLDELDTKNGIYMLLALVLAFVVLVLLCLLCCRHTKTAVADDHNDDDNVTLRNYPRNKRKAHQTQQDGGTLRQGSSFDVNVTNDFSDEEKGTQIRGNVANPTYPARTPRSEPVRATPRPDDTLATPDNTGNKFRRVYSTIEDSYGVVSFDTYIAYMREKWMPKNNHSEDQFADIVLGSQFAMDRINLTGDSLTVEQFLVFHPFARKATKLRQFSEEIFQAIDNDESGFVSVEEFISHVGFEHEPVIQATFAEHDTDESGGMDMFEFKDYVVDLGFNAPRALPKKEKRSRTGTSARRKTRGAVMAAQWTTAHGAS